MVKINCFKHGSSMKMCNAYVLYTNISQFKRDTGATVFEKNGEFIAIF